MTNADGQQDQAAVYAAWRRRIEANQPASAREIVAELERVQEKLSVLSQQPASASDDMSTVRRAQRRFDRLERRETQLLEALDQFPVEHLNHIING